MSVDNNKVYTKIKTAFPSLKFTGDIPVGYLSMRVKQGKDVKDLEKAFKNCFENIMLLFQLKSQKK